MCLSPFTRYVIIISPWTGCKRCCCSVSLHKNRPFTHVHRGDVIKLLKCLTWPSFKHSISQVTISAFLMFFSWFFVTVCVFYWCVFELLRLNCSVQFGVFTVSLLIFLMLYTNKSSGQNVPLFTRRRMNHVLHIWKQTSEQLIPRVCTHSNPHWDLLSCVHLSALHADKQTAVCVVCLLSLIICEQGVKPLNPSACVIMLLYIRVSCSNSFMIHQTLTGFNSWLFLLISVFNISLQFQEQKFLIYLFLPILMQPIRGLIAQSRTWSKGL